MKTHLRYAQSLSMSAGGSDVFGIKCSATNEYWLFRGADPNSNILKLTDDASYDIGIVDNKLNLGQKNIQASAFTVFFDHRGIPYSAYTDETSNTPLSPNLIISVTPTGEVSPVETITVTELTGFIP